MKTLATVLGQISLPGLDQGSPNDLQRLLTLFYLLLGVGFFLGVIGHIVQSRTLVMVGIGLIFLGTGVFMVAIGAYG